MHGYLLVIACGTGIVFKLVYASVQGEAPPVTRRADGLAAVTTGLAHSTRLACEGDFVAPDASGGARWWGHVAKIGALGGGGVTIQLI